MAASDMAYYSSSPLYPSVYTQALSPTAGKESPTWQMIEDLQKGISWHWTKPYMVFETRLIQATTLGLPVEISKNYLSVTAITANGEHL